MHFFFISFLFKKIRANKQSVMEGLKASFLWELREELERRNAGWLGE